jgi:peptidoglycan hydrolase CwlO-like protein
LRVIWLENNKLAAMHPRTFSHLASLERLGLHGNICVDDDFSSSSKTSIEEALATCGAEYALHEQRHSERTSLGEIEEKVVEEICGNKMSGKLENSEKTVETINGNIEKLATRFTDMEKKFDEHNQKFELLRKEIKEIKRMVESMSAMTRSK